MRDLCYVKIIPTNECKQLNGKVSESNLKKTKRKNLVLRDIGGYSIVDYHGRNQQQS